MQKATRGKTNQFLRRKDMESEWKKSVLWIFWHQSKQFYWQTTKYTYPFWITSPPSTAPPPCAAYMRQWNGSALVQVWLVACSVANYYPNQCWLIFNWIPGNKFQWNSNRDSNVFIQENAFEIVVCQNGGHFVLGRWVKLSSSFHEGAVNFISQIRVFYIYHL